MMGCTYLLHLEAKINDEWKCINGYFKETPYGKEKEKLCLSFLIQNGSRSSFQDAYEKMSEIGTRIPFTQLSKEVQEEYPDLKYRYDIYGNKTEEIENYLVVPVNEIKRATPTGCQHHGIYHKDDIAAFETGETDEIWEEKSIEELNSLSPMLQQMYAYKEWDSFFSWQYHFKDLSSRIDDVIRQYNVDTWDYNNPELRVVALCL